MQTMAGRRSPRQLRFERWLRTGFWLSEQQADPTLEVKFNPNHDPDNGQFTFADGAGNAKSGSAPNGGAKRRSTDPKDPANYTTYKVKPGDTLTGIAATRTGVTPADLEALNGKSDDRLQIGDEIKVPNQDFIDEAKRGLRYGQRVGLLHADPWWQSAARCGPSPITIRAGLWSRQQS